MARPKIDDLYRHAPSTNGPMLLDSRALADLNLFLLVLLDAASGTLIPQLVNVLGNDVAFSFIEHFAGMTLKVPSRQALQKTVHDTALFHALDSIDRTDDAAVTRVARRYGRSNADALAVHQRIDSLVRRVGSRGARR